MEIKLFEVRDRATFVPVMAVKLGGRCTDQENWLLSMAGFGCDPEIRDYVILTNLEDAESQYDPYKWGPCTRTMSEAHKYICEHFDKLKSGAVVDVEYILGESKTRKTSERF